MKYLKFKGKDAIARAERIIANGGAKSFAESVFLFHVKKANPKHFATPGTAKPNSTERCVNP